MHCSVITKSTRVISQCFGVRTKGQGQLNHWRQRDSCYNSVLQSSQFKITDETLRDVLSAENCFLNMI